MHFVCVYVFLTFTTVPVGLFLRAYKVLQNQCISLFNERKHLKTSQGKLVGEKRCVGERLALGQGTGWEAGPRAAPATPVLSIDFRTGWPHRSLPRASSCLGQEAEPRNTKDSPRAGRLAGARAGFSVCFPLKLFLYFSGFENEILNLQKS